MSLQVELVLTFLIAKDQEQDEELLGKCPSTEEKKAWQESRSVSFFYCPILYKVKS